MAIKAVFFDIDGTLVPLGASGMPYDTRHALEELRRNGIKVFVCSGRPMKFITNLGDMRFDGYVTATGSVCLLGDGKTEIYSHHIDSGDISRFCDYMKQHPDASFAVAPADGNFYVTSINERMRNIINLIHLPDLPIHSVDADEKVVQMMGFMSLQEAADTRLFDSVLTHCTPASWSPLFFDILPADSNKARGIDHMLSHFRIPLSESMTFGDGGNDIPMLRHAAIGVAMGNASPDVKRSADYVTTDSDKGGVTAALRHFHLIS